jgi:hypothetical protein
MGKLQSLGDSLPYRQVLANRINLLKQEEAKANRKIEETKARCTAYCLRSLHFAMHSRQINCPLPPQSLESAPNERRKESTRSSNKKN